MAVEKKNKPTKGMKLHKFIALGGKPKDFNSVNKKSKPNGGK